MSGGQKRLLDQDPDYESVPLHAQQKRLKLHEQDAKKATIKTIEQIIKTQFSEEISTRETELDTINQRIYEAQVLLDSLRVSIITKYYATGGKSLTEQGPDGSPPSAQVHPTVKKYLGKSVPQLPQREEHVTGAPKPTQAKMPDMSPQEEQSYPEASATNTASEKPPVHGPRSKNKVRIIVGNVSKYIPSDKRDPNDHATHKWMVYVRCPPNAGSEIAQVVRKVRFFLHPSYRPNDLVTVSEAPFHLVRKGWGEFPLRLQLHFCDRRNKPVDIIHNLKLDKTYTGLQTLGAETVVDLWMASSQSQDATEECSTPGVHDPITRPLQVKVEQDQKNSETHDRKPQCLLPSAVSDHVYSEPATAESAREREETIVCRDGVSESCKDSEICTENRHTEQVSGQQSHLCEASNETAENLQSSPSCSEVTKAESEPQVTQTLAVTSSATKQNVALSTQQTSPAAEKSLLLLNNALSSGTSSTQPQVAANGVRTQSFVKCKDALGRVLLIPSTSLLRPRAAVAAPQNATDASKRLPSILKNNMLRPTLQRNSAFGAPRMQAPSTVQVPNTPASGPRYTLLVVPGADKAQSQILLVPTTSLLNKTPVSVPSAPPHASGPAKDGGVSKPAVPVQQQTPVQKKDPVEILEKKLHSVRLSDCKNYSDVLFAVAALFPLCDVDMDEKVACFPYAATSGPTYFGWPLPKRRASEWMRASAIKKATWALVEKQKPDWCSLQHVWSVKRTMLWCRRFGFTPLHADPEVAGNEGGRHSECILPGGTYSNPKVLLNALEKEVPDQTPYPEAQVDEEVNVEAVDTDITGAVSRGAGAGVSPLKSSQSPRMQLPVSDCAHFVRETAGEVGVHMSCGEVEPLVDGPVVEEMILTACKRFASTILRHSVNAAHERAGKNVVPDMVMVEDVYKAMTSLSLCDFLTNSNLGIDVVEENLDDSPHL